MIYAQIKSGQKLHLVFDAEGQLSQPLCGQLAESYRMTVNLPLAHACKKCQKILARNGGEKARKRFYLSLAQEARA